MLYTFADSYYSGAKAWKDGDFQKLNKLRSPDNLTYGHTFSDYPLAHHAYQKMYGVPEELCFEKSWIYLINVTFAKVLLNHDHSQPWSEPAADALAGIENFPLDSYGSRDPECDPNLPALKEAQVPSFSGHCAGFGST
jgi:hypothetical protein